MIISKILRSIKGELLLIKQAIKYKGSLKRKLKFLQFEHYVQKRGVISFRVDRVADLYTKDYFDFKGTTKEQKKWAYSHGFSSYKMAPWYGITTENYKDFLSDYDFYLRKNFITHRELVAWFDNKLNTYYLLSPFKDSLPRHYYSIMDGRIMPLDVEKKNDGNVDDLVSLINNKPLAAKACHGGHGVGFYKFDFDGSKYFVNGKSSSLEELKATLRGLDDYIITDYCTPHEKLKDLCGADTFAVLRIIMVFDKQDGPQLTCAVIRLGCKAAGLTTDHEGTIYCGLTLDEGKFFNPLYRVADNRYDPIETHPDTKKPIAGFVLPNYSKLKELVFEVSRYLPMTPYLVMDIVPTQEGFAILEINSHGQVGNVEPFYPFCANSYNRKVFNIQ